MKVNEIFYSVQGEGKNTGIPMVFVRLAGCNLCCDFCDTKYAFEAGKEMTVGEILSEREKYPSKWVCITGGEPFIQPLDELVGRLKADGSLIQIETNGTIFQPVTCDWLVVSPKKERRPVESMLEQADEIKIVVDSKEALDFAEEYETWETCHSIQPENNHKEATKLCLDFVAEHPQWRLSMQLHKLINIK